MSRLTGGRQMTKVLVIHGPNLNLLGSRETDVYGTTTLDEIDAAIREEASRIGCSATCVQHNWEGAIVEEIHRARGRYDALVINPGAYTHSSYAVRDAIAAVDLPAVEVHLTNIFAREEFRSRSITAAAVNGVICGLGPKGYVQAVRAAVDLVGQGSRSNDT